MDSLKISRRRHRWQGGRSRGGLMTPLPRFMGSICMILAFWTLGGLKLLSGYNDDFLISQPLFYVAAALEMSIGAMAVVGKLKMACIAGGMFFACSIIVALLNPGKTCGCFGAEIADSRMLRLWVAGLGGFMCALVLHIDTQWRAKEAGLLQHQEREGNQ